MRLLLVDDDALVRQTVAMMLSGHVSELAVAPNGRQALAQIGPGSHDVIVLDIVMPEMDGIETLMAIRRIDQKVRIVAITGTPVVQTGGGEVDYLTFARTFGADAVLRKPFRQAELLAAIAHDAPRAGG
jgi:CheY-like chemotaxis protein